MKKGLSFTLTLVVVGVILLMTALSVITLGGSSINAFFETIGGQQEEAVQEAAIRDACIEKMERIDRNYCSWYIETATYSDADGTLDDYSDYMNEPDDGWEDVSDGCSSYQRTQDPRGFERANNGESAYDETASEAGCSWVEHYDETPTVNVEGQTFDCVQEGVIGDVRCPATE